MQRRLDYKGQSAKIVGLRCIAYTTGVPLFPHLTPSSKPLADSLRAQKKLA